VSAVQETIRVKGIRCERCMARLGHVLNGHEGLESANATLAGEVTLAWDDEITSRDALLEAMLKGGFREIPAQTGV
jgi:copper chaperone CopZ